DGNETGAIEPAKIIGDVKVRQPATPQDRAIVIQNGFVGLPRRPQLSPRYQTFIEAVAVNVGSVKVNGHLVGTSHHAHGLAILLVQLSFAPKAEGLRF